MSMGDSLAMSRTVVNHPKRACFKKGDWFRANHLPTRGRRVFARYLSPFLNPARLLRRAGSTLVALSLACGVCLQAAGVARGADPPSRPAHVAFTTLDTNKNQRIEIAEVLAVMPADRHAVARRTFGVFDFDGDGVLTEEEYGCFPLAPPASRSGHVPDPVAARAEAEIASAVKLLQEHDTNADGAFQKTEWETAASGTWYGGEFQVFDANADGAVSAEEIRRAFEIAFGLRDVSNVELRRRTGHVFVWDTVFRIWDQDGDAVVSRSEFVPKFWEGSKAAEKAFAAVDVDRDGRMSLAELVQSDFVWHDVVRRFLTLDRDLDGRVSETELAKGVLTWQRPYLAQGLTAYDVDGDGLLTLGEYRATPLANPVLDWRGKRRDSNGDGLLDLGEFHPSQRWQFRGLSLIFFERLDRDRNGLLDPSELAFDTQITRLPRDMVFREADRDNDKRVTLQEAFGEAVDASRLDGRRKSIFAQADVNGDGSVDYDEFDDSSELAGAMAREQWLRKTAGPTFARKDANGDRFLDDQEWLSGLTVKKAAQARYERRLCDFDGDGRLSFTEYTCLPSVQSADQRGLVPDPIVDEVDRLTGLVLQRLGEVSGPTDQTAEWIAALVPGVALQDAQAWDRDRDGALTRTEIRHGLEVAYGVRHPGGSRLRGETGQVFDWRTFQSYDKSADGSLSSEEFTQRYWGGPEKARQLFARADADQDGRLTVSELERGTLLWVDTFKTFARFDMDRSGAIDAQELSSQAKSWEQSYVETAFPGFDSDGNGTLSFLEFRATPLANPLADWNRRRSDKDADGRLSLAEFHDRPSPALQGLSAFFLKRLDRDGDGALSIHEFRFPLDLKRMDLEVVFQALDANHDSRLSLPEAVGLLPRPAQTDDAARRKHEEKVMRIEDGFHQADRDGSGDVTLSEFSRPEATLASVITGRSIPTHPARSPVQLQRPGSWNWRLIGLVTFNILLWAGLAWLVLRPRKGKGRQ